jgi:hypothetical protein
VPHIRIPAGFQGSGRGKLSDEKNLSLKAISGNPWGAFPPVFLQSGHHLGVFSKGTESGGFTGFSGRDRDIGEGNGARTGVICPQGPDPHTIGLSNEG